MFGSYLFFAAVCSLSILLAIAGLYIVRRTVSLETLMNHHDVAAAMLSIVGTLYAVVLGLVVVGSLTKFEEARTAVEHEANCLRDIFRLSSALPDSLSKVVQAHCFDYATTVTDEEWALMENGDHSRKADKILESMGDEVIHFHPTTSGESNVQQSLLAQITEIDDSRAARTVLASPAFDPIVWSVLIFGAVILVVFSYFFGVENFRMQILMTVCVTTILAINMVIVAMFAYPFSGDVKVRPLAFQVDAKFFQREIAKQPK
jgi:hypothetical protein